ncbi:Gp138 family membrane-puncturing spike protein [Azorhizophilus paspali]|uniref:Gp138 family membrane-puncturing spike protein n=1 Tax=Azorhizophilus paspali TaxID=69963 RepID=A0ABV6SKZ2_AZOPA
MTLQAPNQDQSHDGSLAGITGDVLARWLRDKVDDMLPARVVSYDDATNRATVQPMVMVGMTDGSALARPNVASVPVFRYGGGGFFIRFPLRPGDLGWIKANDRDVSLYLQAQQQTRPNTRRSHSFSDGIFFPDTLRQWAIAGGDADALVIQSLDGQTVVALRQDALHLRQGTSQIAVTASAVDITAPLLRHNGVNIGATHVHGGVTAGGANTGVPA